MKANECFFVCMRFAYDERMNSDGLRTLLAVLDEGTFEAAADVLHVSPSAVSQRIKALESSVGRVLVVRTMPCRPTAAGEALLATARQVTFLTDRALTELQDNQAATSLPLAVNADSLATWFRPVLREVAGWGDVTLTLHVEDQEHSATLLRRGDAMGAITSDPRPVAGCRARRLGTMRYLPCAAPELAARHREGDDVDWARMPAVRYNAHDDLQLAFLRARGVTTAPPQPQIPGSEAFVAAVEAGLGWGLVPELQLGEALADGILVRLGEHVDVDLSWQRWSLDSELLTRTDDAVARAARALRR